MTRRLRLLALAALTLAAPTSAAADAVVQACAVDTQLEAGVTLADALEIGGVVRFDCPAGTNLRMTQDHVLRTNTLIDGEDRVTLDARGTRLRMLVSVADNVILRRITLRGAALPLPASPAPGFLALGRQTGSILNARNAELDRVIIEGSQSPVDVRGDLVVANSTFIGNSGFALRVGGRAQVLRSFFIGNESAIRFSHGRIDRSIFEGQTNGAIRVSTAEGAVEIMHSTFTGTRRESAVVLSQRAATAGVPALAVRANRFLGNDGGLRAGAVRLADPAQEARERNASAAVVAIIERQPPVALAFSYNVFTGNRGERGGAMELDLSHTAGMASTADLFFGNIAATGGAVAVSGGALRMSHALFRGNVATGGPGAAVTIEPGAALSLSNALIAGNTGPAGALVGGSITLANVTIADNDATGLILRGDPGSSAIHVILADNRPADCLGVASDVFRGANMQSADTCPGVAAADAFLDAFYIPAPGSPALRLGDPAICASDPVAGADLAFVGRGEHACALGAFERAPLRHMPLGDGRGSRDDAGAWPDEDRLDDIIAGAPARGDGPAGTPEPGSTGFATLPSQAALDVVIAALAAAEAAPHERATLRIERAGALDLYLIDRIRGDNGATRLRLVTNPGPAEQELLSVDGILWLRTTDGWERAPAQSIAAAGGSTIVLFQRGVSGLEERPPAPGATAAARRFAGDVAWSNGAADCRGRIAISLDAAGLLSSLLFNGRCGETATRFLQAFDYATVPEIEAP